MVIMKSKSNLIAFPNLASKQAAVTLVKICSRSFCFSNRRLTRNLKVGNNAIYDLQDDPTYESKQPNNGQRDT